MTEEEFSRHTVDWIKDNQHQRLGQYLMNKLEQHVACPEIFYEENKGKAATAFYEKFVEK